MTVTNTKYKDLVVSGGSVVEFPFTFKVTNPEWVKCFLAVTAGEAPVEVTNFTTTLYPDQEVQEGGTVTFAAAPASGTIAIVRVVPATQELDYTAYGAFPAESHERALDKVTFQQQLTAGEKLRFVKYGYVTDFDAPADVTIEKFESVGTYLYWKSDGSIGSHTLDEGGFVNQVYVDNADAIIHARIDVNTSRITVVEQVAEGNTLDVAALTSRVVVNETARDDHETRIGTNEASLQGKASNATAIISTDSDIIQVTNPTLANDITLTIKANLPNGMAKLDPFGLVPIANLPPTGGLIIIGMWDASTGNNPTDTDPEGQPFSSGDTYLINTAGNIPLIDPVGGGYIGTDVVVGDMITYVLDHNQVIVGWNKGANVDSGTVAAVNVSFTQYQGITETNAQAATQGLEDRTVKLNGGNEIFDTQILRGINTLYNNLPFMGRTLDNASDVSLTRVTTGNVAQFGDDLYSTEMRTLNTVKILIQGILKSELSVAGLSVDGNVAANKSDGSNVRLEATNTVAGCSLQLDGAGNLSLYKTDTGGNPSKTVLANNASNAATLFHDNSPKLDTRPDGVNISGNLFRNGVAAPLVIATGNNANGYWRQWSDGYMEQWVYLNNIAAGNYNWVYPIAFGSAPQELQITDSNNSHSYLAPTQFSSQMGVVKADFGNLSLKASGY